MGLRELDVAPRVLEQYVAVVDAGDLQAAAATLGVTPRALGRAVTALETEVGEPLLVHPGPGLALTPAGEVVDRTAREVLAALAHLRGVAEADASLLRVAHVAHADTLSKLLDAFGERRPEAETLELTAPDDRQLEQLRLHGLDVAVCAPAGPLPADLVGQPLRRDPLMAIGAASFDGAPSAGCVAPAYGRAWPAHDLAVDELERRLGVPVARAAVPVGSGQELASVLRRTHGRPVLAASSALGGDLLALAAPVRDAHLRWQVVWRRDDDRALVRDFVDRALGVARERSWLAGPQAG